MKRVLLLILLALVFCACPPTPPDEETEAPKVDHQELCEKEWESKKEGNVPP